MKGVWKLLLITVVLATGLGGGWKWIQNNKKSNIKTEVRNSLYTTHGTVNKWFSESDTLDVKIDNLTVSLKLREYPQMTAIGPNPKDRTNTTILQKATYTPQEWGRAFCKDDLLLIGTKENIWPKVRNNSQIEPDFVNVEDRPCFNLPVK